MLDDINQRETIPTLGNIPTMKEMNAAIQCMANNKAPGASGIPAEALKVLPQPALEVLYNLICRYWKGKVPSYVEWQTALLRVLYKGEGDRKDPNNYRGIVLQDYMPDS